MNFTKIKNKILANKWDTIKLFVLLFYIVLVITYFLWGVDDVYQWFVERNIQENEELALQVQSSRQELVNIPRVSPALIAEQEYQLQQARDVMAYEQRKIPAALNVNDLVRDVIKIANDCEVKAIPLSTAPLSLKTVGQSSYHYWHLFVSIEGKLENITNFAESIDGKNIATGTVTHISLERIGNPSNSADTQNHNVAVSGSIDLIVYTKG